jgi:hypothetical protein
MVWPGKKFKKEVYELAYGAGQEVGYLKREINSFVDCDSCGCLIRRDVSIKGTPEIRRPSYMDIPGIYITNEKEYIFYPYFCKRCGKEKVTK